MSSRLPKQRFVQASVTRLSVTAMLMLALLSGIAPFDTLSATHMCVMACCAGLRQHPAGSCADGACHLDLSALPPAPKQKEERLCGAEKMSLTDHGAQRIRSALTEVAVTSDQSHHRDHHATDDWPPQSASGRTTSIAAAVLTRPCQPDCTGGAFGSSPQNRARDSAMLSYAGRPRPPSRVLFLYTGFNPTETLLVLYRACAPRPPPWFFS